MKPAEEYKKEGIDLGNNGQYERAIICFDKCIELNPSEVEAWSCKGAAFTELGRYEDAINCFDSAIALNPNFSFAYMGKAGALAALERFEEAAECMNMANESYSVDDFVQMSMNYSENGQEDVALDCITKAIELEPTNYELWFVKGNFLHNMEYYEDAIECFDKARNFGMNPVSVLNHKAHCLLNIEDFEEAFKCYDEAIEINPDNAETWDNKGKLFALLKCYQEADECFNQAIELDPQNYDYQDHKELIAEDLGKVVVPENLEYSLKDERQSIEKGIEFIGKESYNSANICFKKATELNPDSDEAWFGLGMSFMFLRDFEYAVNAFDKAISINEQADYYRYKGEALNKLDKEQEAIDCLSKSIEINPNYEDGWLVYGDILSWNDHHTGAINCYKEVIKLNPENVKAWRKMGDVLHHELNLHKEAISYYDKAIELNPYDDDTLLMKANALSDAGQYEEAILVYDKVMEINPDNEFAMENKGTAFKKMGRNEDAFECYKKAQEQGNLIGGMNFHGNMAFLDSDYDEATKYYDEDNKSN